MQHDRLWSIILAGGEGERIRPLIQRWLGRHKPKQYCTFVGRRSMFQRTIDRADRLAAPDRRVTVVAQNHSSEAERQFGKRPVGILLEQPANRDTAAGILLPLTYVLAHDPEATVAIYPSDHFIHPEGRFVETVRLAVAALKRVPEKAVLLAARPNSLELEYGWITPGSPIMHADGQVLRGIEDFQEKPDRGRAASMMASGAVWNTLILIARAGFLWNLGSRWLPEITRTFEILRKAIGTPGEASTLRAVYEDLPARNFCSDLLARCTADLAFLEMDGVHWCDWGKPERIVETLRRIGKKPAFSLELLRPRAHSVSTVRHGPADQEALS